MQAIKKKVVVIGGGTGTHTILRGLKKFTDKIEITAIVTMADSGGSTGRLRDEFGQLPVGDARMALSALASDAGIEADILRELFLYRFDKGEGLKGHNFGNLLLTALTDIVGDTSLAIETASQILRVQGLVIPVTKDDVHLEAQYDTGEIVVGEHAIDVPPPEVFMQRINDLRVTPQAVINPKAQTAIESADLIVLGPGDLYTSILANCVVGGVGEALRETDAKIVYVCNLMSRLGQTIGMHSLDYLNEIEKYAQRRPDYMIYNHAPLTFELLEKYVVEHNHVVEDTALDDSCKIIRADVVSTEAFRAASGDVLTRSLIRHDAHKLAQEIISLL